jgi:hypothetical protein
MRENWIIRNYESGDEQDIVKLFNSIFGGNRTSEQWQWEFKENPEGFQALVAVDGKKIVAHLGALNRRIKIAELETRASLEVDGMTHPEYGRKGIFVALGKRLIFDSQRDELGLVYGFPNENALHGHRKLDCIELFNLHVMIKPINFQRISKRMFSNKLLVFLANFAGKLTFRLFYRQKRSRMEDDIDIRTITEFDSRFNDFWTKAKSAHNVILVRDRDYLNWRYVRYPEERYHILIAEKNDEILAWVVVRVLDRYGLDNGAIVDMLALPNHEDTIHALLLKAVDDLQRKGVDLIACSIPKSSTYNRILRKCGFITCPKSLNPKEEPFIIYPLSKNLDSIKNPSSWYITWGDTDVI